jgi:hypothetical protein
MYDRSHRHIFIIKWEFVTVVGSKTCLTYIIESILAIQSTSNGMIYDRKITPSRPLIKQQIKNKSWLINADPSTH